MTQQWVSCLTALCTKRVCKLRSPELECLDRVSLQLNWAPLFCYTRVVVTKVSVLAQIARKAQFQIFKYFFEISLARSISLLCVSSFVSQCLIKLSGIAHQLTSASGFAQRAAAAKPRHLCLLSTQSAELHQTRRTHTRRMLQHGRVRQHHCRL
jgi:hypothetical protein